MSDGLKQMAWGMLKKVVVADRLAVVVNQVYGHPGDYTALPLIVATVFFAFQIYCDFSGYSDIAIGAAKVMGFKLMTNFAHPYFSRSTSEFWKRWHISLSTWFRDYVYIPLGGNRVGRWRHARNLMITFCVSGLWHGANWTFVAWGALHGTFLVLSLFTHGLRERVASRLGYARLPLLRHSVQRATVFVLVSVAWVFFRAATLHDAVMIVSRTVTGLPDAVRHANNAAYVSAVMSGLGVTQSEFYVCAAAIALLVACEAVAERIDVLSFINARPLPVRWTLYYAALAVILFYGAFNVTQPFIYFQF